MTDEQILIPEHSPAFLKVYPFVAIACIFVSFMAIVIYSIYHYFTSPPRRPRLPKETKPKSEEKPTLNTA